MAQKKEKTRKGPSSKSINKYKAICADLSSSQCKKILKYLLQYGSITTMKAYEKFGCTRISARIFDLKQLGIGIETEMVYKKNPDGEYVHYGVYRLV